MRKDKRAIHLAFIGALCGGLRLMGVGVGVQLAEVSALSYGGEVLVEHTPRVQRMVVTLSPHAERIHLKSDDGRFANQIRESYRIQVQESVDPGTAVVEFRYEGTPVKLTYDSGTSQVPLFQSISFSWFHDSEISTLMTCKEALTQVGLSPAQWRRYPSHLSGGEQQRVAIARTLAIRCETILADEPTGNLDEENTRSITDLLLRLAHEERRCVIVVTHDLSIAARADAVLELRDGRLLPTSEQR